MHVYNYFIVRYKNNDLDIPIAIVVQFMWRNKLSIQCIETSDEELKLILNTLKEKITLRNFLKYIVENKYLSYISDSYIGGIGENYLDIVEKLYGEHIGK